MLWMSYLHSIGGAHMVMNLWIKIGIDVFALAVIARTLDMKDIDARIAQVKEEMANIDAQKVTITSDYAREVKSALEDWNGRMEKDREFLQDQLNALLDD